MKMINLDASRLVEAVLSGKEDEDWMDQIVEILKTKDGFWFVEEEEKYYILVRVPKRLVLDIIIQNPNLVIYHVNKGLVRKMSSEYFGGQGESRSYSTWRELTHRGE